MAAKYPSIPEPTTNPAALQDSVLALKQAFEILSGQRGDPSVAAVTAADAASSAAAIANATATTNAATAATTAASLAGCVKLAGNQTTTGGYSVTTASIGNSSGVNYTVNPAIGNYQAITNNGAWTLTAPASDCAVDILVVNAAGAGSITFPGFSTSSAGTGDALNTTVNAFFIISIRRIGGVSTYTIKQIG